MKSDSNVPLNPIRFFNRRTVCVLSLAHHAGEHKGSQAHCCKDDAGRIGDGGGELEASFAIRNIGTGYSRQKVAEGR